MLCRWSAGIAASRAYTLTVLRTFGGPQADVGNGPYINAGGVITGTADTDLKDPYGKHDNGAFNSDRYVQHTYAWRNGALTDLGALGPDSAHNSSYPNSINAQGDLAGVSDNGAMDPLTGNPEAHAVFWKNGHVINLGALGGNESQAFSLNDRDQITGVAENATPDPFSMLGEGTETHAFLWQNGRMRDLGTLGGPDSFGWFVNARGQVAGVSYASSVANPVTKQPPSHVFLWQNGTMRDLGSLGGSVPTFGGVTALNNRGQIVGQSNLIDNKHAHPFLWNGKQLIDLGTFGGLNGFANSVNERGDVAGAAQTSGGTFDGFLWRHGTKRALRPTGRDQSAFANSVNNHDQVVGTEGDSKGNHPTAILWTGGHGHDLNTLAAPSALHLTDALTVTKAGEIIGEGVLPNGDLRNFVLMPNNK
jgi:probable HAF family extracellular repeat protein